MAALRYLFPQKVWKAHNSFRDATAPWMRRMSRVNKPQSLFGIAFDRSRNQIYLRPRQLPWWNRQHLVSTQQGCICPVSDGLRSETATLTQVFPSGLSSDKTVVQRFVWNFCRWCRGILWELKLDDQALLFIDCQCPWRCAKRQRSLHGCLRQTSSNCDDCYDCYWQV